MARYVCSFTLGVPLEDLFPGLREILKSCNFEVIYDTDDYLMGREIPGRIAFAKLVTVEALVDRTKATPREVRMELVIKNEELPLQVDNHCRQMFQSVRQAIAESSSWQLLESAASS